MKGYPGLMTFTGVQSHEMIVNHVLFLLKLKTMPPKMESRCVFICLFLVLNDLKTGFLFFFSFFY